MPARTDHGMFLRFSFECTLIPRLPPCHHPGTGGSDGRSLFVLTAGGRRRRPVAVEIVVARVFSNSPSTLALTSAARHERWRCYKPVHSQAGWRAPRSLGALLRLSHGDGAAASLIQVAKVGTIDGCLGRRHGQPVPLARVRSTWRCRFAPRSPPAAPAWSRSSPARSSWCRSLCAAKSPARG